MEYNYHKNAGQLAFIKFVKGLVHLLIRPKVEWKDKSLKKSLKASLLCLYATTLTTLTEL